MNIFKKIPYFDVGDGNGDVFFRRWKILKTAWFSVYLHQFFRSDRYRCLHNHPWWFWVLILRGGYWEHLPTGRVWRHPGYFARYPADHFHRIEIDPAQPKPWSLVLVGPKFQEWGFRASDGSFVAWDPKLPNPVCETGD
jgi:hypothetical protein